MSDPIKVTIKPSNFSIGAWSAYLHELGVEGEGPTIPDALRSLATSVERFALREMVKMLDALEDER